MNSKKRRQKKHHNKKRKPKVTKEYQETESEISNLLKNKESIISKENEEITSQIEIDFFTIEKPEDSEPNVLKTKRSSIRRKSLAESEEEQDELVEPISPARQSVNIVHSASSFIQIEDLSPTRKVQKEKIIFNEEDLYYPLSNIKTTNLQFINDSTNNYGEDGIHFEPPIMEKDKNLIRMVNRFNEEGKFNLISPNRYITNQQKFSHHSGKLYKTENVEKNFIPFYYAVPVTNAQREILSSKKFLKLTVNELKFTEHTLQSNEHRLAIQLENTFAVYQDLLQQNIIKKIKLELKNLRETLIYLLENSNEDQNIEKLENYTRQIKFLRKKLHKEELLFKNSIQNALQQWITLKNCRKVQGFNYTDFKLVIQIEEVDMEEDEQKWNMRYQIELNEILREKFEKYYKEKRIRKTKKGTDEIKKIILRKPDVKELSIEVENNLRECTRDIGEPKIKLFQDKLQDRCKNLDKFKDYFLQIIFDKEFVGATKHFHLNSDFQIDINQSFGVYLESSIPRNIKIEIFEKSKLTSPDKLCKCYIPLQLTADYSSGYQENIEFSSNRKEEKISGILKVTIFCETELNPGLHNKSSTVNLLSNSYSKPKISKEVLKSWYENNLINPLDPDCISLFNNFSENYNVNQGVSKSDDFDNDGNFNLNEDLLSFCSKEEITNNPRFNMLKARYHKEMKYKNFKFIPLFENEIEEIDSDTKVLDEGNWMDAIDLQKYKGKKYIQKLYDVILNHCTQLKIDENNSNLLIGDDPPTWRTIFDSIKNIFVQSRPLNPTRSVQLISHSSKPENFNIVINIARATGIPVRNFNVPTTRRTSSGSTDTEKQTLLYGNVRPYICVSYKEKILRTMTAEGSNPTWNEQLILEVYESKENLKEDLLIQIFDEYIEDLIYEGDVRSLEVYQRIHTNWLGEYRIPMKTIFDRQHIEGCFEINLPKLIIGYCKPTIDINDDNDGAIPNENILEIRDSVFIWLYINVEPKFEFEIVDKSPMECSELKEVKLQIEEWCILVNELAPSNFLNPLICTETGKRICMTRLLECIPLPIEAQFDNIDSLIRHYVSLIPILKSESDCLGLQGVWLSNQTVLDTTWASPKDLGVLLACFFMSLGIRCWLVLGISYPQGETAYILTQENFNFILTDPNTGKRYDSKDVQCPLNRIFYLVNQENIFCNLQKEERVSMTDFNINDNSLWLPLFTKNNPAPIGGFHSLNYKYRHSYNIFELRKSIERKIIKKISSWRSTRKTIWNRAYTNTMYEILTNLEQDAILEINSENYFEKLMKEITNYKVFGFTLNFPYVNLSAISKQIRSTGIHLNVDKDIEFSLSVYIHHYPNNILSCWIFILTLTPIETLA